MSNTDDELVEAEVVAPVHADQRTTQLERMRDKLSRFMPRALDILTELAEYAENERVRLSAAESILDRAGLGKSSTTQVTVSQAEHDIATNEAELLVAKIKKQQDAKSLIKPSIETLIVLEGDDDTLPTAREGHIDVIITTSSEIIQ